MAIAFPMPERFHRIPSGVPWMLDTFEAICDPCHGKGWIDIGYGCSLECKTCGGRGWVPCDPPVFHGPPITPERGAMSKAIEPSEAVERARNELPPKVYEAFNDLIVKNLRGKRSVVTLKEATAAVCSALDLPAQEVRRRGYLDVEDYYRKAGWRVVYDRPAYNETYEATFEFTIPS